MVLSRKMEAIEPSLTLKISALAAKMKSEGLDVVSFGAGEPDFETPEYIRDAGKLAIDTGKTRYTPASGIVELKKAVCARYFDKFGLEYAPENVVVSSGAKHTLYNVMQVLLNPGDEVVIITPYWLSYSELVKMADGIPVFVDAKEEDGFRPDPAAIEAAITEKTKAIVINSPSNPTGVVYDTDLLAKIAAICEKHDMAIISDEIYDELVYDGDIRSIACVSEDAKQRTIIVNGMSKAYAMTGWRIGYVLCDKRIASVMSSVQSNATSNPCSIAQYASVAALNGGKEELESMRKIFAHRRDYICELIDDIPGLTCARPSGAFYALCGIKDFIGKSYNGTVLTDDITFAETLLKEKLVAVVPGTPFGAEGFIRLSYACSEENTKKGLDRIKEFLSEVK